MFIAARFTCFALLLLSTSQLCAQSRATPPVIDIGFGLGRGLGGRDLASRNLLSMALLASRPVYELDQGTLVVAANLSDNMVWDTERCIQNYTSQCSAYPSDLSVSALGGWTKRIDQLSAVRVLAGPTFFTATDGRRGLGMTSRIDLARPVTSRISFVVWAQSQFQPQVGPGHKTALSAGVGERLHVATMGIGVRSLRIVRTPRGPRFPDPFRPGTPPPS